MGRKATNIAGRRFGFLIAIKPHVLSEPVGTQNGILWDCKCDCGGVAVKRSGLLRSGVSTHCSNHSKRWHEEAAAKARRDAAQREADEMGETWHEVYGRQVDPHVQGRLFLTGQVTNTARNGRPLGKWVTRVPEGAVSYTDSQGHVRVPTERVLVPEWAYVAKCSCGWPVLLRESEVGVLGAAAPRVDCSGEAAGSRTRVHREPGGSPAWIGQCSQDERDVENKRRYQLAMAQLETDIGDDTALRRALRDMVRAQREQAAEARRAGKPKRVYRKRAPVVLPERLAAGEKSVFDTIKELKEQT